MRYGHPFSEVIERTYKNLTKDDCNLQIHFQLPINTRESLVECLEMLVSKVNIILPTYLSHTAVNIEKT